MKLISSVMLVVIATWSAAGEVTLRPGPERFYYQNEWGTHKFEILRAGEKELKIKATESGRYTFRDDGANVEGVLGFEAEWHGLQNAQIFASVLDQCGNRWISQKPASEGVNRWALSDFTFAAEGPGGRTATLQPNLYRFTWEVTTTGAVQARMKNCRILLKDGSSRELFLDSNQPPPTYLPQVVENKDLASVNLNTPRVVIAENSMAFARGDWMSLWPEWSQREFPGSFGIDFNGALFPSLAKSVRAYHQAGIFTMFESHMVPNQAAWVRNHQLSAERYDGYTPDSAWTLPTKANPSLFKYHGADTTQEAVFEIVKHQMESAFDLGFDSFLIIDYVWPYFGGRWGYGHSAVAQWREYVRGQGWKIDLVSPKETWGFGDYWAAFSSIPLAPEEFGWKTWDDFACGKEANASKNPIEAKRLQLFNALWHYHHLVFLDRLGRVAEARGKELSISINPEDIGSGDDVTLMSRLNHLGSMGIEIMADPSCAGSVRHTLAHLRYRDGGPKIDHISEINAGGHGPSRYDRDLAYAMYYDITASCAPRLYNNQYVESLWPRGGKPSEAQAGRFDHWFAGANAFLLRHAEENIRPPLRSDVTVIASRSIIEYQDSSSHHIEQDGNLAPYLHALNVEFEQVGRDSWKSELDEHTRVLFFTPSIATPNQRREVNSWISRGEGKTLVLHGSTAWKSDHSVDCPSVDAVIWSPNRSYRESMVLHPPAVTDKTLLSLSGHKESIEVKLKGDSLTTSLWEPDSKIAKRVLVTADDGAPLVYEWMAGKNKILYVAADLPARTLSPVGLRIVEAALRESGVSTFARRMNGWSLRRWEVPGGNVLTAWNMRALADQAKQKYYARIPTEPVEALTLFVNPRSEYTIYSVFDQSTQKLMSDANGEIHLSLQHTPDIFYYGCDSLEFQQTLSRVAETFKSVEQRTRQQASIK